MVSCRLFLFGRRNLASYVRTTLALELESLIAEKAKANQVASGGDKKSVAQNSAQPITPIKTRQEIAKVANVSDQAASAA